MSYATTDEIVSEFKSLNISAANSAVDTAEVTRFIDEACAQIHSCLANRYVTPVTASAEALLLLKKITIDLVVFRITKILSTKKAFPVPDENVIQEITEGTAYREAMKLLEDLSEGRKQLIGAELLGTTNGVSGISSGTTDKCPVMQKDVTQW